MYNSKILETENIIIKTFCKSKKKIKWRNKRINETEWEKKKKEILAQMVKNLSAMQETWV